MEATDPDHRTIHPEGTPPDTALCTKAVVAICVLLVPEDAVGANGVPVSVGLLLSALLAIAAAIALNSVSISAPLTILPELFAGRPSLAVKLVALV